MTLQEAPDPETGRRRALVIATSKFSERGLGDLPGAKSDLFELTPLLTSPEIGDFEVTSLLDASKAQVEREIERVFKIEARGNDFLLLYITGHGVADDFDSQSLWFPLKDFRKVSHRSTALEARWIRNVIEASKSRRQLIIIDSCYSGMFADSKNLESQIGIEAERDAQSAIIAKQISDDAFRYYIFACGNDERAFTGRGQQTGSNLSRLTGVIVSSLQDGTADSDGDGRVSLDDLWNVVEKRSRNWSDQRPRREVGGGGRTSDTYLAVSAPSASRSGTPTPEAVGAYVKKERRKVRRRLFLRRHRRSSTAICFFVLAVLAAGLIYKVNQHVLPTETVQLTAAKWQDIRTDSDTTFPVLQGGVYEVAVPTGHLTWYGLYYPVQRSCDYTFRVDARHVGESKPADGAGWGYGISVRSTWDASKSSADGWTFQDEFGYETKLIREDLRITQLSNVNSTPYFPSGIIPDNQWHSWVFNVQGSDVTVQRDQISIGKFPLDDTCGGVFIRVWSETVQFRKASLTTP